MANPVLGKSLCSDWFSLGQDFAVRTVSTETVQPVYFCFEAKPANWPEWKERRIVIDSDEDDWLSSYFFINFVQFWINKVLLQSRHDDRSKTDMNGKDITGQLE